MAYYSAITEWLPLYIRAKLSFSLAFSPSLSFPKLIGTLHARVVIAYYPAKMAKKERQREMKQQSICHKYLHDFFEKHQNNHKNIWRTYCHSQAPACSILITFIDSTTCNPFHFQLSPLKKNYFSAIDIVGGKKCFPPQKQLEGLENLSDNKHGKGKCPSLTILVSK